MGTWVRFGADFLWIVGGFSVGVGTISDYALLYLMLCVILVLVSASV